MCIYFFIPLFRYTIGLTFKKIIYIMFFTWLESASFLRLNMKLNSSFLIKNTLSKNLAEECAFCKEAEKRSFFSLKRKRAHQ